MKRLTRLFWSALPALAFGAICMASAQAGPTLFRCLNETAYLAPEFRLEDREFLCGISYNTPVPGYGERADYVDCLLTALREPSHHGRGDLLTAQCSQKLHTASAYTGYMPTALYCMSTLGNLVPEFREVDKLWLCGLSNNTPVPGYGDDLGYTSCLIETLQTYPAMKSQGDTLIAGCRSSYGSYVDPYYPPTPPTPPTTGYCPDPNTYFDASIGRCVSRSTPTPPPAPGGYCPDPNTHWDARIGRCVSRSDRGTPRPRPVPAQVTCSIYSFSFTSHDAATATREVLRQCAGASRGYVCRGSDVVCR